MKKTQIKFNPYDRLELHQVKEEDVKKVLNEDQFKTFKKNKAYSVGSGSFKMG